MNPEVPRDLGSFSLARLGRLVADLELPAAHLATKEELEVLAAWSAALTADGREGARKLALRLDRALEACREERRRVVTLLAAESAYCPGGASLVAGVDEAGRGPLAGPVVAAAVVLEPGKVILGLDDSKRVPEDVREEVYPSILAGSRGVGVGVAGTRLVEDLNVQKASFVAMRRAITALGVRPDYVLVDGFRIPGLDLPQRGVVHGDALCASIAAASIVAKVTRDRIMRLVGKRFPAYGFERNKGYATPEHWAALRKHGPCAAHRRSFLGRLEADSGLFAGEDGHD